jgi:hypothetical protein
MGGSGGFANGGAAVPPSNVPPSNVPPMTPTASGFAKGGRVGKTGEGGQSQFGPIGKPAGAGKPGNSDSKPRAKRIGSFK